MTTWARALCGLLALQCLVRLGAAQVGIPGGVHISWGPSQKCNDAPGGNCALCNEPALQCLVCLPGYGFNANGACQKCTDAGLRLCLTCDLTEKPGTCLQCVGVPNHDKPLSWGNPGFPVYQDNKGVCRRCYNVNDPGCLSCNKAGKRCIRCNDGYVLKAGMCVPCKGKNCEKCGADRQCTTCVANSRGPSYGLNPKNICRMCISRGCVDCNEDRRKCNTCKDGLPSIGERGFGKDGKGNCRPCASPLCAKCQADFRKCTACATDPSSHASPYLTKNGQCRKCTIEGCMSCTPNGRKCKQCQDGYIHNSKRTCDKLPKCSVKNCYDCRGNTRQCRQCVGKFFLENNRCLRCAPRCEVCGPKNKCTQCVINYGLIRGKCLKCMTKNEEYSFCEKCDGNRRRCTKCWPSDKFRPDPRTGGCVRYKLPVVIY